MTNICQNCDQTISDNFCFRCGQKKFKRIDRQYIADEVQYTILQTNKGFLYSIKNILINPGKTAREFIEGNRINHYTPISLAFVLTGISTFISYKVMNAGEMISEIYAKRGFDENFTNSYVDFISNYISIVFLLFIPIFAIFTKIAFKKWGQNYYEHIVMNSYILSFYNLVSILLIYPLMILFKKDSEVMLSISMYSMLVIPFILLFFFKGFYSEKPMTVIIKRILVLMLLFLGAAILFAVLLFAAGLIAAMVMGPEAAVKMVPGK